MVTLCSDVKEALMSAGHASLHAVHIACILSTTACRAPGCRKPFSFLLRPRHHCRACGLLFCGACCWGAPAAVLPCSCCEVVGPVFTLKLALGSIRRLSTFTRLAAASPWPRITNCARLPPALVFSMQSACCCHPSSSSRSRSGCAPPAASCCCPSSPCWQAASHLRCACRCMTSPIGVRRVPCSSKLPVNCLG